MTEIVENNRGLIISFAKRYANRFGPRSSAMIEDFVQDATVAFIERIMKADSIEEAMKFKHEANHEMSLDVLSYQPLSVPRRTSDMKKKTNSMPKCCIVEEVGEEDAPPTADTIAEIVERTAYERFRSSLPDRDQKILDLAECGYTRKEIASRLGLSYDHVQSKLLRLHRKYVSECGDEGYLGGNQQ